MSRSLSYVKYSHDVTIIVVMQILKLKINVMLLKSAGNAMGPFIDCCVYVKSFEFTRTKINKVMTLKRTILKKKNFFKVPHNKLFEIWRKFSSFLGWLHLFYPSHASSHFVVAHSGLLPSKTISTPISIVFIEKRGTSDFAKLCCDPNIESKSIQLKTTELSVLMF